MQEHGLHRTFDELRLGDMPTLVHTLTLENIELFELPPKRWTPLLSSFWSRKVFYGYGPSSISG